MSPRDEANAGQPTVNDPARRPDDRERGVFVLGDGTHLTLHFTAWTWDRTSFATGKVRRTGTWRRPLGVNS